MQYSAISFLSRVVPGALLLQATAPAALAIKDAVDARLIFRAAAIKAVSPPPPMPGVPTMKVTPPSPPGAIRAQSARKPLGTILNEVGRIEPGFAKGAREGWQAELASSQTADARKEWLRLWLAEAEIHREYPAAAIGRIDALLKAKPSATVRGLAKYDRAIALFYCGMYGKSRTAFEALLKSREKGFPRKDAALWVRHARGCEGYHEDNERQGVPVPERLDPLCGASAIAVSLRAMGLPYDKERLRRLVRHTGQGSSMQDLVDACDRLGLAAHPVQATEKGLRNLPLPAVAFVEGDHFVSVVDVDESGVEYVCSDCGGWPGGPIRVSWNAWRAMKPGAFMTVSKRGSAVDGAMARLAPREAAKDGRREAGTGAKAKVVDVSVSVAQGRLAGEVSRLTSTLIGNVAPLFVWGGYMCGSRPNALHCPVGFGPCCSEDSGSPGKGGPVEGDPVNLATGEEEYRPEPDLTIYNPTGPSVTWSRTYNSMGSVNSGFGSGWSDSLNMRLTDTFGYEMQFRVFLILPNGGSITFTTPPPGPPLPPGSSPQPVECIPPPGIAMKLTMELDPVTYFRYYVLTFPDRTQMTFNTGFGGVMSPTKIADRAGNYVSLQYTLYGSWLALASVKNAAGTSILTIGRDSAGKPVSATDWYGRSVYYHYGTTGIGAGLLDQVSQIVPTGASSPPLRYQYGYVDKGNGESSSGYPYLGSISVPSPTGTGMATATIDYDPYYVTIRSITDANGNKREYSSTDWNGTPDANKTTVKVKDPLGNLVRQYTVGFDAKMNETFRKNAAGQTVYTKNYGTGGATFEPSSVVDGNGRTWNYTYDSFGNVLTTTSPKGTVTTQTYDYTNFPTGELKTVKPGAKTATEFFYYPNGLLQEVDTSIPGQSGTGGVQTTTYTYTALGNVATVTAPGNNATAARAATFGYTTDGAYTQAEALGRPITRTDALGKTVHFRYDARGNLTSLTDALGNPISTTYDLADRETATVFPATGSTGVGNASRTNVYLYPGGPLTQVKSFNEANALVRATTMAYGLEGELLSRSGSTEAVTTGYDAAYATKTLADGAGAVTNYSYDLSGRTTQVAHPGATGATYDKVQFTSYDAIDNLLSRTDGKGQVTNYTYADADGQLSAIAYPGATANNVAISYDAFGRETGSTDATGSTTTSYDDLDNVTSSTRTYTGLAAKAVSFTYWPDGSRKTMVNPAGTWTYSYDAVGRYVSLASPAGTSSATYFDNGRQATRTLPNGAATSYAYNAMGMLTGLLNKTSGGTTISQVGSFVYDGIFNLAGTTASVPGFASQSGTTTFGYDAKDRLTAESSTRLGGYAGSYVYDAAGNPSTFKGVSQSFNGDNQRTGTGFVYDGAGNPTTYKGTGCAFSPENRVTAIGSTWTAGYRADGLRAWKQVGTTRTYYLYDQGEPVVEMNASGTATAVNVFAPDGLVARQQGGAWIQYLFDQQGSVAQRLNAAQAVTTSSAFDAYGTETSSGTPGDTFGYNARWGYVLDRETGLYLCQARYYDAQTGRWVNRDPLGPLGGINVYAYSAQSPNNSVDPTGLVHCVFARGADGCGTLNCYAEEGDTILTPGPYGIMLPTFPPRGTRLLSCRACNNTTNPNADPNQNEGQGPAPTGDFPLGAPRPNVGTRRPNIPAQGPAFCPVGVPTRTGIGVHGGRRGPESLTNGCIRVSNDCARELSNLLQLNPNSNNNITISDMRQAF